MYKRQYFTGSDNIDDTKGIIDESKPIKLVLIDEVNEFFEQGEGGPCSQVHHAAAGGLPDPVK